MTQTNHSLGAKLDAAYRNRPYPYGFQMEGGRVLTVVQATVIINNVTGYDRILKEQKLGNCANCGYPMTEDNTHYIYEAHESNYCNLCHELYYIIVTNHPALVEAHRRWKQAGEPKENDNQNEQYS